PRRHQRQKHQHRSKCPPPYRKSHFSYSYPLRSFRSDPGFTVATPGGELVPALGFHKFGPAAVEIAEGVLARFGLGDVHHRAGDAQALRLVIRDLVTETLLIAVGVASRDRAAAGGVRVVPVLHVVLLGHPAGAGITDVIVAQEILDLPGSRLVDKI